MTQPPDWRIVIVQNGKFMCEDRHGPDEVFWSTSCTDPFVLWFDTPSEAERVRCHHPGTELRVLDVSKKPVPKTYTQEQKNKFSGRMSKYRVFLKSLRSRVQYLSGQAQEVVREGRRVPTYQKSELIALQWALEVIACFVPEENRPEDAPIPVLADVCPRCWGVTRRIYTGRKRPNPWRCDACGHTYTMQEGKIDAKVQ